MQATPVFSIPITATGTIRAHRFVNAAGDESDAGEDPIGVSRTAATTGDLITVDVLGTTLLELAATLAAGAYVSPNADGEAIAQAGAGIEAAAVLLQGGDDGDIVEALLLPHGPTPA